MVAMLSRVRWVKQVIAIVVTNILEAAANDLVLLHLTMKNEWQWKYVYYHRFTYTQNTGCKISICLLIVLASVAWDMPGCQQRALQAGLGCEQHGGSKEIPACHTHAIIEQLPQTGLKLPHNILHYQFQTTYGTGHEGAVVLLPGFAIKW